MTLYQLLKDFAGPSATLYAALVAARYIRRQTQIAQQQAITAIDALRYDLFEKRMALYRDVQDLIRDIVSKAGKDGEGDQSFGHYRSSAFGLEFIHHFVKIDEAVFLFPDDTCNWLQTVKKECSDLINAHVGRDVKMISLSQGQLLKILLEMPKRFQRDLSFNQIQSRHEIIHKII